MKTTLAWILTITILALLVNLGFAFQNEPDGFRGLKWGNPPTENMLLFEAKENKRYYTLPNEKLSLGNVNLSSIVYAFYDQPERLMVVSLYFKGTDNYDLMTDICGKKFGTENVDVGILKLTWWGEITTINLEYNLAIEGGVLILINTTLWTEYTEAQKKEQAEKAEEDW